MLNSLAESLYDRAVATLTAVLIPDARIYWPYLLTTLVMAIAVVGWYLLRDGVRGGRLVSRTWSTIFDPAVWLHRSALIDYACFGINGLLVIVTRFAIMVGGAVAAGLLYLVLILLTGSLGLSLSAGFFSLAAFTVFSLIVHDFANYGSHYLMHRVPILWEFHKVHHSAQVLTPITAFRIHPGEVLFIDFIEGLAFGGAASVGLWLFGAQTDPMKILGLNVGVFVFYMLGANLRHSHVWLPYPRWLSHIFISPAQHQIHHSSLPQHHDANFGVIFAVWDWMLGTLYVPREREKLVFGLYGGEDVEYQTIKSLYVLPLVKARSRVMAWWSRRSKREAQTNTGPSETSL